MSVSLSPAKVSLADLFRVFFSAGLTFGGGLAIVTVLDRELVQNRRAIAKQEFLTYYALARVVPTGTQTALAVSLGNHFAGLKGSIVAITGLLTPVFVATLALAALFTALAANPAVEILPAALLPAAMALVVVGAVSMSKDTLGPNRETALAIAAFLAAVLLRLSPAIILLVGGLLGIAIFWREERR